MCGVEAGPRTPVEKREKLTIVTFCVFHPSARTETILCEKTREMQWTGFCHIFLFLIQGFQLLSAIEPRICLRPFPGATPLHAVFYVFPPIPAAHIVQRLITAYRYKYAQRKKLSRHRMHPTSASVDNLIIPCRTTCKISVRRYVFF